MVAATSDATFRNDVLDSSVPTLVDFWAPWCGPCRMLGPVIEKIGDQVEGNARVYKLNVDENPQTAREYGITGIPTVMVFKNGELQKKFVGVQPESVYKAELN